jgi:hypothetical protein
MKGRRRRRKFNCRSHVRVSKECIARRSDVGRRSPGIPPDHDRELYFCQWCMHARRTFSINAAHIRPAFFSTVWLAPTAESEVMLYTSTISAVNSSFDLDNPHPRPLFLEDARWPCAAIAGCRWLRMRDVVTGHIDGDGSGVGEGDGAATRRQRVGGATVAAAATTVVAAVATTVVAAPERRMWNVAASISVLQPEVKQGIAESPSPCQNRRTATAKLRIPTFNLQFKSDPDSRQTFLRSDYKFEVDRWCRV